ncbi:hypothetical protein T439DRAFT_380999 [Meredithblackwellia eburnea MCA 4105]
MVGSHRQSDTQAGKNGLEEIPVSSRKVHVTRLHNIVKHLVSLPPTHANARRTARAWNILASCSFVDPLELWELGARVLDLYLRAGLDGQAANDDMGDYQMNVDGDEQKNHREEERKQKSDWLKVSQRNMKDLVRKKYAYFLAKIDEGEAKAALEEIDQLLPTHPYHDSIELNVLGGILSLHSAQPPEGAAENDSSSDLSSSDDEEDGGKKRKRVAKVRISREEKIQEHFKRCQSHSPFLFQQAKERFFRAAQLEKEHADEKLFDPDGGQKRPRHRSMAELGEGARWYAFMDPEGVRDNFKEFLKS